MPDTGPTSERLETLRERWEADPGSRVFLQLADEYRRLGRIEEAAGVLEEGLEASPHHLAAQVALGRCRLDLGAPDEAAELLERVVESDPTQMVAYRLLVEAYLRQGRADEARERLRVYSLLNDADPEIAELRRRIGEIDRESGEGPAEATAGAPSEPEIEAEEPREEPSPEPPAPGADGEPFPGLAEPSSLRRYLEALAAGELFEVEVPAEEPAPATGGGPTDEVFDLESPRGASGPDLSSLLEPPGGAPPGAPPEPGARPTLTLGRLYLRQGHAREAEEIFREVLAREPDNEEARRTLEELARAGQGAATAPPAADPPEEAPPPPLQAPELLAGYGGGEGVTERKRYVLERYRERLRGGARRDVH